MATRAGVSPTTVSHVLSARRPVAAATRERVLAVIAELGYRPNELARGLATGRSHAVSLIIPDITNPFYPVLARGLQDVLTAGGYHVNICNTDADRAEELAFLEQAVARRADGVVFLGFRTGGADLRPLLDAGMAVVMLGDHPQPEGAVDRVHSDDAEGMVTATTYLLDQGMERIGFINGQPGVGPGDRRRAGYQEALTRRGLPAGIELTVRTDYTRQGGVDGMRALLDLAHPPRAVVCANDLIAIGALDVARERGLGVPGDVAVVGFDDIEAAALVTPALTTVVNPARELGQSCGRLLLDRLDGTYDGPPREVVVPHGFTRRASA